MENTNSDSIIVLSDLSDSEDSPPGTAGVSINKIHEIDAQSDSDESISFVETAEVNTKIINKIDDLNDSGDSISFIETEECNIIRSREIDVLSDSSFEYPEVNFNYQNRDEKSEKRKKGNVDTESSSSRTNASPIYDVDDLDDLDSGLGTSGSSFSRDSQNSEIDKLLQKYAILRRAESSVKKKKTKPRAKKTVDPEMEQLNNAKLLEKERLKAERQLKKDQQAKDKALKSLANTNYKKLKPEEYIKSMNVIIDENIQTQPYFTDIINTLHEYEVSFKIESQLIPKSISWKTRTKDNYLDEKGEICSQSTLKDENQMIFIWNWDEVVEKIANGTFCTSVKSICDLLPQKQMTLIIYGIIDYFSYQQKKDHKAYRDEILGTEKSKKGYGKHDKLYGASPKISRKDLEIGLSEVQILNNVSNRVVSSAKELGLIVYQYTKAIAEIPLKAEKRRNMEEKVSWYAAGDNRDTVKVDKDGNGLMRLWQQQLCQFNLSSLETAAAICQVYGSPLQLIEAYMKCTPAEGEMLLKDIPIRRAAGAVTTLRKIGPELSKKVYTMFTSEDGEVLLNNV